MNKKILASIVVGITSLCATSANAATAYSDDVSSLDIIGRMKINLNNNDADSEKRMTGTARLGASGKYKVNDIFGVFGKVLWDFSAQETAETDEKIHIRYGYLGFDFNDFGTLSLGRFEDAFYKTTAVTDVFTDWGTMGVSYWGLTDNDYGGRKDGQILYDVNYQGFIGSVSYQFKDSSKLIEYGVGGTVGYEFSIADKPLGFMVGYNHYEGLDSDADSGFRVTANGERLYFGADKNELAISAYYGSYGAPGFYAAVVYNNGRLKETYEGKGVEAVLSYTTPGADWTFTGGFEYMKNCNRSLTSHSVHSKEGTLSRAWSGEIDYNLTTNFVIYLEGERAGTSVYQPEHNNAVTLGFVYNF